ncbi:MAG: serine/threonine protein kinase [Polyangiales bacterium]|jgi:serine/threonine protein kinase
MTTVDDRAIESWEGRIVDDRYRVQEKIGEGGMGAVYAAEHLTLHKQVAFKTILPKYASDGEVSARFQREAMATGRLDHPHVAGAMDFGSLPDGGAYLVMQLVKGRSVEEMLIDDGGMSWPRACSVGAQVADALSAAHQAGIVHRDLKPENVMIEERDDGSELALVLDFGIAQIHGESELGGTTKSGPQESARAITRIGAIVGTPGYMAPEQALAETTDERADLYSLGVLLWEMLTGRSLFDSDDLTEIVSQQLSGNLTPRIISHTGDESTPPELQTLIDQLLARQPANRPENAGMVRDVLRDLTMLARTSKLDNLARLTPVGGISTERHTPTRAPALDSMRGEAASGRWRAVAVVAITALLLTGIVGGISLMLRPSAEDEARSAEDEARTEGEQLQAMYELARHETLVQELGRQQDIMLHNDDQDVRRQAALFVLDFEPADEVLVAMRAIAILETSQSCSERRDALDGVIAVESGLARPSVQRWEDAGRCRRRGRRVHCYACVRSKIREALEVLPPDPNAPVEAPVEEAPGE